MPRDGGAVPLLPSVVVQDRPRKRPPEVAIMPLPADAFGVAAALLADGTAFAPDVMRKIFAARAAAGTLPVLLGARVDDGAAVVGAVLHDPYRPVAGGRLFTRIAVAPHARGRGVGRALALELSRLLPTDHAPLSVEVDAGNPVALEVTERWGGVQYQRSLALELDLHSSGWREAGMTAEVTGMSIEQLREDSPEPAWRAAFAVYAASSLDLPDRAGAPEPSYEMFRAQLDHAPGVHIARRHGDPVGVCGAGPDGPDSWYVCFTGTLASARRTGVARALKHALHDTAAARGVRFLRTSTLDVNTPMLALNAAFGYRVTGGVVRFEVRP